MHEHTLTRVLFATSAAATLAFLAYAYTHPATPTLAPTGHASDTARKTASTSPSTTVPAATTRSVDTRALLDPTGKYLGLAQDGLPASLTGLTHFTREIGKQPNLVAYYVPWGQPLNQTSVLELANDGILPLIQFEPATPTIAQIAGGASDRYTTTLAQTIKALAVPVVISFGHEMNGDWYPWGTTATKPADFVKAWRRIHDAFTTVGATNVIWLWDANVIYPVPDTPLAPLYPGDAYVDWIGLTGYYNTTEGDSHSFTTLFTPTMRQARRFSLKPFLIAETAVSPSPDKPDEIRNLFASVETRPDVLGFVWFNYDKPGPDEADWMIDTDPASATTFAALAHDPDWDVPLRP